jgi:cell wall-associated NlpC family hydrolase
MSSPPISGSTTRIAVETGDTLSEIAAENNMSLGELLELNPQFDASKVDGRLDTNRSGDGGYDPDFIRPGDTIIVPKQANTNGAGQSENWMFAPSHLDAAQAIPGQASNGKLDLNDVYNRYRGGDYVFGGGRDGSGLGVPGAKNSDCSAFVSAVWREHGVQLPAHTDAAYNKLKSLGAQSTTNDPKPGDVVFWMGAGTGGAVSHHMGIYMGDGKVLQQTGANGGGVQVLPIPKSGIEILRDPRM